MSDSSAIEFKPWPKIPRLNRDIIITEKIDGTNAAVGILEDGTVYAQSRTRIITPEADNFGFARWVYDNAETLTTDLGVGLHFGEWWGSGIQRGYGLAKGEKRFSLFNVSRYGVIAATTPGVDTVPTLYEGPFSQSMIDATLYALRCNGSKASPGFMRPEGIVVYHTAANQVFKVTLEGDEAPKSRVAA